MEGALARTTTPNSTFEETCYELNLSQNTNVTFSLDESLLGRRAVGPQSRRRGTPAGQDQDLSNGMSISIFLALGMYTFTLISSHPKAVYQQATSPYLQLFVQLTLNWAETIFII